MVGGLATLIQWEMFPFFLSFKRLTPQSKLIDVPEFQKSLISFGNIEERFPIPPTLVLLTAADFLSCAHRYGYSQQCLFTSPEERIATPPFSVDSPRNERHRDHSRVVQRQHKFTNRMGNGG